MLHDRHEGQREMKERKKKTLFSNLSTTKYYRDPGENVAPCKQQQKTRHDRLSFFFFMRATVSPIRFIESGKE